MDLEDIISQSVQESQEDQTIETSQEATEVTETKEVDEGDAQVSKPGSEATEEATEVKEDDAAKEDKVGDAQAVVDDFAKKIGIPAESAPGRENRIPYSRVKKIVEKAEKDARTAYEKEFAPKITEFETKVKGYEDRLEKVGQFEQILFNDPQTFLPMLEKIPAYKEFFSFVRQAYATSQGLPLNVTQKDTAVAEDPMPQPDSNGSYTMPQLQKLMEWQSRQTEKRIEAKYAPLQQQFDAQQKMSAVMPEVQAMIAEARTWEGFSENEEEITKVIREDPKATLDSAYRKVVVPKLIAKQTSIKEETRKATLEEVKKAGQSTSVSTRSTKPVTETKDGPKDLEDIIWAEVRKLKG